MPPVTEIAAADDNKTALNALAASAPGHDDDQDDPDRAYAAKQGWVPKDQYSGPDDKFVDFKTYAQRAREINPIINERNRKLESSIEKLQRENEQLRKDTVEALRFQREFDKREFDAKISDLRKQKAEAIKDGDGEKVNTLDEKIDEIRGEKAKRDSANVREIKESPTAKEIEAAGKRFTEENPWMKDDKDRRTRVTFLVSQDLLKDRPDLQGKPEFFDELMPALQKDYPELFPKKKTTPLVDSGSGLDRSSSSGADRKYTIKDLPKDARDTCRRFVDNGYIAHKDGKAAAEQMYVDEFFAQKRERANA
jgi:hypothetical protein